MLFHVKHYLPMWTSIDEMSLGDTPLILEACDKVLGLISSSFALASDDKDFNLL